MNISIIVATFNGAGKIQGLLDALLCQSKPDFELIVVVDGSMDNTPEVIEAYREKFSCLKLVIQPNKGRAGARNRGVEDATGDLLVFYDDDMIPGSDSVLRHLNFHNQYTGLVSGNPIELEDSSKTDIRITRPILQLSGQKNTWML
ncbi:MAG: glycosyltransferase family A protein [Bacteroidota bacterium]